MKMKLDGSAKGRQIWKGIRRSPQLVDIRIRFTSEVRKKCGPIFIYAKNRSDYEKWRRNQLVSKLKLFDTILEKYCLELRRTFWYLDIFSDNNVCSSILILSLPSKSVTSVINHRAAWLTSSRRFGDENSCVILFAISPYAETIEIRDFFENVSKDIKIRQKLIRQQFSLPELTHKRGTIYPKRNALIQNLWDCPVEELQMLSGSVSRRKDILISSAFRAAGQRISSDLVRKITAGKISIKVNSKKAFNS